MNDEPQETPRTDEKACQCAQMQSADDAYWAMVEHAAAMEAETRMHAGLIHDLEAIIEAQRIALKSARMTIHYSPHRFKTDRAREIINRT